MFLLTGFCEVSLQAIGVDFLCNDAFDGCTVYVAPVHRGGFGGGGGGGGGK